MRYATRGTHVYQFVVNVLTELETYMYCPKQRKQHLPPAILLAHTIETETTRLGPYMIEPTRLSPHTIVPTHVCAHTRLCPHTFVPRHVCAQTRLCPHTFVPTHDCAHTRLCPHMFVPKSCGHNHVWAETCTFVSRHVIIK